MVHYRSIFVSDVHLGTPDCRADYLLDFLRSTRSQFLYLVGDIVDLEALARRAYWPASHSAVLAEVLAIAARGTRVVYVPGNHDAALRGLHGQRVSGIEVQLHAVHEAADGRRYRVSHGDEFDPTHLGRDWLTWVGERTHRGLCWCNRMLNLARRGFGLAYLPLSIVTKARLRRAMQFIDGYERRVAADCIARGYDGHICGHIHFGSIRHLDGALYLNDGDWVEHCTALIEDGDGTMRLLHWSEHRSELASSRDAAARRPRAFAPLSPQVAAAMPRVA